MSLMTFKLTPQHFSRMRARSFPLNAMEVRQLRRSLWSPKGPGFYKITETMGRSLSTDIKTVEDANKVLLSALGLETTTLLSNNKRAITGSILHLMIEDRELLYEGRMPKEISEEEYHHLAREFLLYAFRKKIEAKQFLANAGVELPETLEVRKGEMTPPGLPKGIYFKAEYNCPLFLGFHYRPMGDARDYHKRFPDFPIYLERELVKGPNKFEAYTLGEQTYSGGNEIEIIEQGDLMRFYIKKPENESDDLAIMILKGYINLLQFGDLYACDTKGSGYDLPRSDRIITRGFHDALEHGRTIALLY